MKFGIIGNNDGPLRLLRGLKNSSYKTKFVGLQKTPESKLKQQYLDQISKENFFCEFDEEKLLGRIKKYEIDLLINCFCNFKFEKILSKSFDIINVHLSLLPAYRGRHPMHWALINGEEKSGYTIHRMNENFDEGPILWQSEIPVNSEMSVKMLRSSIMNVLEEEFGSFMKAYSNNELTHQINSDDNATYARRRFPEDSELTEWDDSKTIYRKVKAMSSENNPAYFTISGQKITCLDVKNENKLKSHLNFPQVSKLSNQFLLICCKDGKYLKIKAPEKDISEIRADLRVDIR